MTWEYMPHQKRALEICDKQESALFAFPTGTGKTLIQLGLIAKNTKNSERTFLFMPLSVIPSWLKQANKFFPELKIMAIAGCMNGKYYSNLCKKWGLEVTNKKDNIRRLIQHSDAIIMNPQASIRRFMVYDSLKVKQKTKLTQKELETIQKFKDISRDTHFIIDESDLLGSPKSKFTKSCLEYFRFAKTRYLFSATPGDSTFQMFAQAQIMNGTLFGDSFYKFQMRFGIEDIAGTRSRAKHGWPGVVYKENKDRWGEFRSKLDGYIYEVNKKDVLKDLPKKIHKRITIPAISGLPKEYNFSLSKCKDAAKKSKEGFLTNTILYQQVASGFLYGPEIGETEEREPTQYFNSQKMEELKRILAQNPTDKAIIWICFQEEAKLLLNVLGRFQTAICSSIDISGGTSREQEFFHEDWCKYLIAHPATVGRGVDGFQDFCNINIVFSPQWSYKQYHQMISRLHRKGQKNQTIIYEFSTLGTIEPSIWVAMEHKKDFQDFLLNGV